MFALSAEFAVLNAFVPHITVASGANTPKAISEAAAHFLTRAVD